MMDKFPEAFERYESYVDTSDIETFNQLLVSVKQWGKEKITLTRKQKRAIAIEGKEKLGVKPIEKVRVTYEEKLISYEREGKLIEYVRKARITESVRDIITGRFVAKEEFKE